MQRFFESTTQIAISFFTKRSGAIFSALVLIIWRLIQASPADPDLFARLAMGKLVEQLKGVPLYDPFSFTEKLPIWFDHEWLSGVVFYQIFTRFGDPGLIILKLALASWTILLLVRASLIYTAEARARTLWIALCILEASYLWGSTIRCQVFTYFSIALIYYGYARFKRYGELYYLALIPFSSLALVNMHGGYALTVIVLWIIATSAVIQRDRFMPLVVIAALSSLAPLATPYGYQSFSQLLISALAKNRETISEWAPVYSDLSDLINLSVLGLPIIIGVISRIKRKDLDLTAITLLLFSLYCGFCHIRFIGFAALTAIVFGAKYVSLAKTQASHSTDYLKASLLRLKRSLAFVGLFALAVMLAHSISYVFAFKTWQLDRSKYPVAALDWLKSSGATGRLLVDFNNGSFALWQLYPQFLISMDGRYEEVYTDQAVEKVAQAFAPHTPEGAAALKEIAPSHILLAKGVGSESAVAALLANWLLVYSDPHFMVFQRNSNNF